MIMDFRSASVTVVLIFASLVPAVLGNVIAFSWNAGILLTQRLDPIYFPGQPGGHAHGVVGSNNFDNTITSSEQLRSATCTTNRVKEDMSNYWFPELYFEWANGTVTSVLAEPALYYTYEPHRTVAFPDDFRMVSGSKDLRTYDGSSHAQQAISFKCLMNGKPEQFNGLPPHPCEGYLRTEINFPSCWDGHNIDSPDHKSHVSFPPLGPGVGECTDPRYPELIPRIFLEVTWRTTMYNDKWNLAKRPNQPFVFAHGDPLGYGNHADFYNGWKKLSLQNILDNCNCTAYGAVPTCCAEQGILTYSQDYKCDSHSTFYETATGTIPKLPGDNPVTF